ncbi:MAG: glycosyltransferase family 4 protein [Gammaproteobacteria bacterium]|nr:glycosyltransferase family 4 protein [Gammaproteobacteria bacterium]MDH4255256.1 glycosyltransferase family 4 protein [Gammaproteobacteria bacterium]MDH5311264.1 glycosyltransferase family 4 protein [Gammaproteobacteria bacterium]
MKILHVETGRHLYGGPQQVLYLCSGLARLGVDSVLVCPPASGVAEAAARAKIRTITVGCAGDFDLRFGWRLKQLLADERPDIVHCHSRRGADSLGGLAAKLAGIPAVLSRRVDNPESGLLAKLRYRPYVRVVAISTTIAGILEQAGVERRKIVVIRSAVDAAHFPEVPDCGRFHREFRIEPDHFVIAAAAQFIERKGHRYLLEAVAALRPRYPKLRVVLFGQGPLQRVLKARCAELGIADIVQFAGFRRDLDEYLGCIDILVHPALQEGLGVITLKAQAAGVPVVGFRAGGLSEAVLHGETGLLVPTGDSEALADAIARLADDNRLRHRYGATARQRMRAEFTIEGMAEQHLSLYKSILNG